MAITYKNAQGVEYLVPEDNEVFRAAGDTLNAYKRIGDKVYSINLKDYGTPTGYDQTAEYNLGDIFQTNFMKRYNDQALTSSLTDINQFVYTPVTSSKQTISASINPNNPYNLVETNQAGQTITQGPSLQTTLQGAGATQPQIQSLTQSAQQNMGGTYTGAFTPEQLKSAGVLAPTPQSIQQGIASITPTGAQFPTVTLVPGTTDSASVKALQDFLVKGGYMTQAQVNTGYGVYGPQTTAAVRALQEKLGVTPTGNFGPLTIKALQSSNLPTVNTTPGAVTVDKLTDNEGNPIIIGGMNASGTFNANAVVAGAEATSKSIQDYINMLSGPDTPERRRYDQLVSEINSMLPSTAGRGAAQLEAEKAAGVEMLKKALAEVNALILTKTAEYKALMTNIEGKPITMNSIIGAQAQAQKAMAAEIGLYQAQALGLQGQLQAAQEAANRAVDLKYSDAKDAIEIRMQQLSLIEGILTKQERIRADAISMYLEDQRMKLEEAKSAEKSLTSYNLSQMQKYPSAGIRITDDYETTQRKILGSTEYKLEIANDRRLAGGGSGGADSPTPAPSSGSNYPTPSNTADNSLNISTTTRTVLDGMATISSLTPSKQTEVKNELYSLGFNSSAIPDWFRDLAQEERAAQAEEEGMDPAKYPLTEEAIQRAWNYYRTKILSTASTSTREL